MSWNIQNGSGWNHHKTVDSLRSLGAEALPEAPEGYAVLVAPISDKPFGLRCALVKICGRKLEPSISIHSPGGNYAPTPAYIIDAEYHTADEAGVILAANGYQPTNDRPLGWPSGEAWYRHADGTWASVEMLDDGPDSEEDGWARDRFDLSVQVIYSCKCDQQSDDDSQFFIKQMTEKIDDLTD